MKGIMEVTGAVFLVFFVVIIIVLVLLVLTIGNKISYSYDVIPAYSKPYKVGLALLETEMPAGDRTFREHITEISAVGIDKANSGSDIKTYVQDAMDDWDIDFFTISVEKGDEKIFEMDSLSRRCGTSNDGVCTFRRNTNAPCGIASREDISGINACPIFEHCCIEDPSAEIISGGVVIVPLIKCGKNFEGFCDQICGKARSAIDDSSICGIGLSCCSPIQNIIEFRKSEGLTSSAEIPVFWKDGVSVLRITTGV